MEGKRVRQAPVAERTPAGSSRAAKSSAKSGGSKAPLIAGLAIAAAVAAAAAGLGMYSNGYDRVYPGVTVAGTDLSGLSYEELEENLPVEELLEGSVTVTADGETLGTYTQAELGASVDTEKLRDQVWDVGRQAGAAGWLKNTGTMLRGRTGGKTEIEPDITEYDTGKLQGIAQTLAEGFDREPVDGSYELSREGLYATKPADGRALNQDGLVQALSHMEEGAEQVDAPWDTVPAQQLDLETMAVDLKAEVSPARYDVASGQVVDGTVGFSMDPQAAAFVLESAQPGETVQLPAETIYPELTAEELKAVLFRDVLSTASTTVSGSSVRKGNVRLSGQSVNGTVLNDGDIFDYNKVVGERTTARGFGAAPSYVNGETVDTVGGGICQTSSTVYLATLLANLEIVERYAHRYVPAYIAKGMDATVSWGGPEFRFKNNTGYPIRLDVSYANSQLTVTIVGTKTDNTYVKMTNEVLSTKSPTTEYVETTDLPAGKQQQKQSAYTGYEVVTYRNVYDGNGNLISSKQEAKSSYKSRNQIIMVGKGAAEPPAAPPTNDSGLTVAPQPETGGAAATPAQAPAAVPEPPPAPAPEPTPEPEPEPVLDTETPDWLNT